MSTEREINELAKYCVGVGLNIGCGNVQIADSIGVDLNKDAKAAAIIKRGDQLGLPDNSCDYVISANCFEHIDRGPIMVLREWLRVLKPGGVIAIVVPDAEYGMWAMTGDRGIVGKLVKKDVKMEHLHAFTTTTLRLLFKFAGMGILRCEVIDRYPARCERTIICVGCKTEAYE